MDRLREALEGCDLCDLGFVGDKFTWRNHSTELGSYIGERIYGASANEGWFVSFPDFVVENGIPRHSDHRLVVVHTRGDSRGDGRGANERERGFRFEAWWLKEDGCSEVIKNACEEGWANGDCNVAEAMQAVAGNM
ncbi:elongation factor 1-alpha [Hordeum vulgare]|nr:elongation factor 1-alpha [Hordeum vulgare]